MDVSSQLVQSLLERMAGAKGLKKEALVNEIIHDSLDQMRFLVALEEQLGIFFDDTVIEPFKVDSFDSFLASVQNMIVRNNGKT